MRSTPLTALLTLLAAAAAAAPPTRAVADPFPETAGRVRRPYSDFEVRSSYLPMRDGVRLAMDLALPRGRPAGQRRPAILRATRYYRTHELRAPWSWMGAKPDADGLNAFFTSFGYAVVHVDVRGSGASFGRWPHPWSRDEVQDLAEVVDWIVAQPWSNGRVGAVGDSYEGSTAEWLATLRHPAVRAVVPRFNEFDVYTDIAFPGGVFLQAFVKGWNDANHLLDENALGRSVRAYRLFMHGVRPVDGDRGRRLLREAVLQHAGNADVFAGAGAVSFRDEVAPALGVRIDDFSLHAAQERTVRSSIPLYSWGSWQDGATADAVIHRFLSLEAPVSAVIGAWSHGALHDADPYRPRRAPVQPRRWDQRMAALRFLEPHLEGDGATVVRRLVYYTMGEGRWKETVAWPVPGTRSQRLYFGTGRLLTAAPPSVEGAADTYPVDFEASTGTTNRWHTQLTGGDVFYPDRTEADRRLLAYTGLPLEEDLEITGHPVVSLWVKSTAADGAFFAYLEDVDEAGRTTYLTEGQLRALHRRVSPDPPYRMLVPFHSFRARDAEPLEPGSPAELRFGLLPLSALVRRGHRLRVSIAGHDQDSFARVPAQGVPVVTLLRDPSHPSFVDIPVVPR
jgi:uncharacterized protein